MPRATIREAIYLKVMMDGYRTMSGQAINSSKSYATFSPSTSRNVRKMYIFYATSDRKGKIRKYLGMPLSGDKLYINNFNYFFETVQ